MEKRDFIKDFVKTSKDVLRNEKPFTMVIEEEGGVRIIGGGIEEDKMAELLSNAILLHLEQEPYYTNAFIDEYVKQLERRRI